MTEEELVLERLKLLERGGKSFGVIVETLSRAINFYYEKGRIDVGEEYLFRCQNELAKWWRSCVRNVNDIRLYQELGTVQFQFSGCYSIMRRYSDIVFAYDNVLRFKNVASLAVRERNRILHDSGMGEKLKLSEGHNEMADREVERIFNNRSERYVGDAVYRRKLAADAEFYEQFPKDAVFTDITWEKVRQAIPDNSAVIEYFFCDDDEYNSYGAEASIDIYIICKKKNCCILNRETIPDGRGVLKTAREFVSLFQEEAVKLTPFAQSIDRERREILGRNLYRWLIEPVLVHIQGMHRLFIAPDRELINLPFEILKNNDGVELGAKHDVIQMECARDFLFCYQDRKSARGSLIIGNPQFEVDEWDFEAAKSAYNQIKGQSRKNKRILGDIPFSKVEACMAGKQCDSRYYTGCEASKNLLLSAEGYQNIHIATHGYFFSSQEAVYASGLAFAGAENWLQTGQKSRIYGNGIMTADEISRLNLHSVELAVISACDSGMNEILKNKGFHGLLGGFSAAGVHYVISNLWAADDMAATILMGYFYYEYMKKHETPYIALKNAKQYIRKVTTGRLKQDGWFAYMLEQDIDSESKKQVLRYKGGNEWERPFENEVYWGGFICYQCN